MLLRGAQAARLIAMMAAAGLRSTAASLVFALFASFHQQCRQVLPASGGLCLPLHQPDYIFSNIFFAFVLF